MGFLVLAAFLHDDLSAARPLLLLFAGVGVTAAGSISSELNFKNLAAFAGAAISLTGSYMQINQAIEAAYILAAVAVLAFGPFVVFAFRAHRLVPIVTLPIIAALAVMSVITVAGVLPVILIGQGCCIGEESWITAAGVLGVVAIAFGIAAGFIVALLLLVRKGQPQG